MVRGSRPAEGSRAYEQGNILRDPTDATTNVTQWVCQRTDEGGAPLGWIAAQSLPCCPSSNRCFYFDGRVIRSILTSSLYCIPKIAAGVGGLKPTEEIHGEVVDMWIETLLFASLVCRLCPPLPVSKHTPTNTVSRVLYPPHYNISEFAP